MQPSPQIKSDLLSFCLMLAWLILVQAVIKWQVAGDQPFSHEQFRDWARAVEVSKSGDFPAYGPPMASGPDIPGGWYYYLLSKGLRGGASPIALSHFTTLLFSIGLAVLSLRMRQAFGSLPALATAALLAFHPVVISMGSLYHNPNVALPFLLVVLAAFLNKRVGFPWAMVAGFSSIVAIQCNLPSLIALSAPLLWLLAGLKQREDYSFSVWGYTLGLMLGCLGYLPFLQLQLATHFGHVNQGVAYREQLHFSFERQFLKPLFFFIVQPSFEVSSYFGARFIGFIKYFNYFRTVQDWALFLITYGSFLAVLGMWVANVRLWFKSRRWHWDAFFTDQAVALQGVVMITLPFWFFLAGRFDVKYTGLFMGWSYIIVGATLGRISEYKAWHERWLLVLSVVLLCLAGLSIHQRVYVQRGSDLDFSRYSYDNLLRISQYISDQGHALKATGVEFSEGDSMDYQGAVKGLTQEYCGWKGTWSGPTAKSRVWVGSHAPCPQQTAAEGFKFLWYDKGMYFYANF